MRAIDGHACDKAHGLPCDATPGRRIVCPDGKTFLLRPAENPVNFPAQSTKRPMASIGFWYEQEQNNPSTHSVVIIFRDPPARSGELMQQVEIVADKLARRLARARCLSLTYEFDGSRLV
jgi:hypothetical protein